MAIEIVSFPIKMVDLPIVFLSVYQAGYNTCIQFLGGATKDMIGPLVIKHGLLEHPPMADEKKIGHQHLEDFHVPDFGTQL